MKPILADRLQQLPPYLFLELDKAKRQALSSGVDVIDLGIGDPDIPTPQPVVDALYDAANDPSTHRYPLDAGISQFRETIAAWCQRRFDLTFDPATEVLPLIGSKEGLAHTPFAFVNPGDVVLVPDPGYPVYHNATLLAGGEPHRMPLTEERGFLPDLEAIPAQVVKRAKLLFLNYPNNPTAATADNAFYEQAVAFARRHNIIVCQDAAYSEIGFDGYRPPSFLRIPGAREVGVEFHSLSKTFNMTGWRVGWVCGNPDIVAGIAKIKSNMDSGVFTAIQRAAIAALSLPDSHYALLNALYQERRDTLVRDLNQAGWHVASPKSTFFVWTRMPAGFASSAEFVQWVLQQTGVVITPGNGFGRAGEGFVRISLTTSTVRLAEAARRISQALARRTGAGAQAGAR